MYTFLLKIEHLTSYLVLEGSVAVVIDFLSLAVELFGVVRYAFHLLNCALEQTLDNIESMVLMRVPLALTADPVQAIIAEVLQLQTVETAVDWNLVLVVVVLAHRQVVLHAAHRWDLFVDALD